MLALPDWVTLEPRHYRWLLLLGALAAVGSYGLTEAFRSAPAAVVSPLEYTALLWGILIDRLVWHVLPSVRVCCGGAVVIASGLYLIWRERRQVMPVPRLTVMEVAHAGEAECRPDLRRLKKSLANKRKTHHEQCRGPWTIRVARAADDRYRRRCRLLPQGRAVAHPALQHARLHHLHGRRRCRSAAS